jgi:hypothetical protein
VSQKKHHAAATSKCSIRRLAFGRRGLGNATKDVLRHHAMPATMQQKKTWVSERKNSTVDDHLYHNQSPLVKLNHQMPPDSIILDLQTVLATKACTD